MKYRYAHPLLQFRLFEAQHPGSRRWAFCSAIPTLEQT